MRVALISDMHCNAVAFDAVLRELEALLRAGKAMPDQQYATMWKRA